MNKPSLTKETKEKIEDLGLTNMQLDFVNYFIFITNMDAVEALKLAGYQHGVKDSPDLDPKTRDLYIDMHYKSKANDFLKNQKIVKCIKLIKEEMSEALVVDRMWVIKKLKSLADNGSENTQLKATELIGKHLSMFTEIQQIQSVEDPAAIARAAFNDRIREDQEKIVEFKNGT